jgi:hypothetical protein
MGSETPEASAVHEVSDADEAHEARMLRPLRGLTFVILALGFTAALIGDSQMRLFVPVFYLPAGITFVRPRWSQMLIWIMWSATWGMLAMMIAIGSRPALFTVPSHWLMAAAAALLFAALPLLRWYLSPRSASSALPEARVLNRD